MSSLDSINTADPSTYDTQLEDIFQKTETCMKGNKALSFNQGKNRRFDQCLDILGVMAQTSAFARDRANILVDRTNYVRTRWYRPDQPLVSIDASQRLAVRMIDDHHAQVMKSGRDEYNYQRLQDQPGYENYSLMKEAGELLNQRKGNLKEDLQIHP